MTMIENSGVTALILICVAIGLIFAVYNYFIVASIQIVPSGDGVNESLVAGDKAVNGHADAFLKVQEIGGKIAQGAAAFLEMEYKFIAGFLVVFSILLILLLGLAAHDWNRAGFAVLSFLLGSATSIVSGFIGMRVAVFSNTRTAVAATNGLASAFSTAFRAGSVMGFCLVSLGIVVLYALVNLVGAYYTLATENTEEGHRQTIIMFECVAGYGLGGSCVGLFGRVGGGIYTKAADVGADLVGKVELDLNEDDARNPATIADNVGDNVGDVAGMGADLFGSFAESACATMVIAANSPELSVYWPSLCFPMALSSAGIIVCLITSFFATHLIPTKTKAEIEPSLKRQIAVSTLLMTPAAFIICYYFLPHTSFTIAEKSVTYIKVWVCCICGLWSGAAIGYITEYFTSHAYTPVREVAEACKTGAATNVIFGLALGYKSVIIPVFCLAITIYVGYSLAGMFGIAVGALGILSTLPIALTIDAYGPICDNAGGIAEMAHMPADVRDKTDALDAAGNTTAAIGKGFAIGSAALVSLALSGAFFTIVGLDVQPGGLSLLQPFVFAGLLVGAMLPYWFSAMTMKSVGQAAQGMVVEVRRQVRELGILENPPRNEPDYKACVAVSTDAAIREMIAPGVLVMSTPILVGFFFGVQALAGLLCGALVSGVQIAISSSNTGGAWDNAKKYIEGKNLGEEHKKGSETHKAAVIGDTVGDPLKDTSGPSLNILMKLMAIISVVFSPSMSYDGLFVKWFS